MKPISSFQFRNTFKKMFNAIFWTPLKKLVSVYLKILKKKTKKRNLSQSSKNGFQLDLQFNFECPIRNRFKISQKPGSNPQKTVSVFQKMVQNF